MQQASLRSPFLLAFSMVYYAVKRKRPSVNTAMVILASLLGKKSAHIVLADDDPEDREIFLEVIGEVVPHVKVTIAKNGKDLMNLLLQKEEVPDILFLDLNMPFKNGQECLVEIRNSDKLKTLPVIIYSTSRSREHIDETFLQGANFYFPKPDSFRDLRTMISRIFALDWDDLMKPRKDKFILSINQYRL